MFEGCTICASRYDWYTQFCLFSCLTIPGTIHKFTWNEECHCIPAITRDGQTHDVSQFLHFTFLEQVLYLENLDKFLASKECPSYFCGFRNNDGDSLN